MYYDKWWKNHNHNLDDEERVSLAGCPRKSQTLDQVLHQKNSQSQIILKSSIVLFLSTKFCSVRNERSLRIVFDVTFFDAESDGECAGSCEHWWNFCCSIVWSGFCCYGKKWIWFFDCSKKFKNRFYLHPSTIISLSIHLYLFSYGNPVTYIDRVPYFH